MITCYNQPMKNKLLAALAVQLGVFAFSQTLMAQEATPAPPVLSTPAASDAEKEAFYAKTIENRVGDILKTLNLSDESKAATVHDILVKQYHELRVRDAEIDTR